MAAGALLPGESPLPGRCRSRCTVRVLPAAGPAPWRIYELALVLPPWAAQRLQHGAVHAHLALHRRTPGQRWGALAQLLSGVQACMGRECIPVLPDDDPVDTTVAHRRLRGHGRLHRLYLRFQSLEPVRQLPAVHERCGLRHRRPAVPQRRGLLHIRPARPAHDTGVADGLGPRHARHDCGAVHAHLQRPGHKPHHHHGRAYATGADRRLAHGHYRTSPTSSTATRRSSLPLAR